MLLTVSGGRSRVVAKPEGIWVSIDGLKADIANRVLPHTKQKHLSLHIVNTHKSDPR